MTTSATGISKKATKRIVHRWRPIEDDRIDWDGKYEISNKGRIRRLEYTTSTGITFRERILKGTLHDDHTVSVRLLDETAEPYKWHFRYVHELLHKTWPSISEWDALDIAEDEHGDEISVATYRELQTWVTHGVAAKRRPARDSREQAIARAIRSSR